MKNYTGSEIKSNKNPKYIHIIRSPYPQQTLTQIDKSSSQQSERQITKGIKQFVKGKNKNKGNKGFKKTRAATIESGSQIIEKKKKNELNSIHEERNEKSSIKHGRLGFTKSRI